MRGRRLTAALCAAVLTVTLGGCAEATRERSRIGTDDVIEPGSLPGGAAADGALVDPLAGLESAAGGSDPNAAGGPGFADGLPSGAGGGDPRKGGGGRGGATADTSPTGLIALFTKIVDGTYTVTYRVAPNVFREMTVAHQGNKDWVTATDALGGGYWTSFVDGTPVTSCVRDLTGTWSCVPAAERDPNSGNPLDALAALGVNPVYLSALIIPAIQTGGYTATDRVVLGRPATCVAAGAGPAATTVCIDRDGIPLLIRTAVNGVPIAVEATAATTGLNAAVTRQPA
jgi:hypothetical protein